MLVDADSTPLHVLVFSPQVADAASMLRCVQSLGHAAETCATLAAAETLVRERPWDVVVVDLDGLRPAATEGLAALQAALGTAKPLLLGVAEAPTPRDVLEWAALGLDRLVPPDCESGAWHRALDPAVPRGFDPDPLARLRELDVAICRDSVRALLDDTPRKLAAIETGIRDCESVVAQRVAHALKGGAAQLGALHIAALCVQLETQLAGSDFTLAAHTCQHLAGVWRVTTPWLEREATA